MNILISVDIEGVAGVYHPEQTRAGNPEYEQARRLMTREANAAVAGAFQGGAQKVYVNDSHGRFRNMLPEELDERASVIQGRPRLLSMAQGVELNVQGIAFVGYHSYASGQGILAHTINSFAFAKVLFNGELIGEAGIYGAVAGEYGVPVIFGSGDDVFISENRPLFSDAEFVQTKQAIGQYCGVSLSCEQSCQQIKEKMADAARKAHKIKLYTFDGAIHVTIHTTSVAMADLFCGWPAFKREATTVVAYKAQNAQDAMRILNCCSAMSASLR